MLQYDVTMKLCKSPDVKKHKLNKIYTEYFSPQTSSVHSYYTSIVSNYISLLEWQLTEKIHNPKLKNILDAPVLESLYHACSNFKWSAAASSSSDPAIIGGQSNPYKFVDAYKVSQSQFDWIALNERAQDQKWCDLDTIFEKKTWHTLKTTKTFSLNVPLDRVVRQLHALDAPVAVLNSFLARIDDVHKRLELAKRYNASRSIVDALVELKDRGELERYAETLAKSTDVRIYADNAIKNLVSLTTFEWAVIRLPPTPLSTMTRALVSFTEIKMEGWQHQAAEELNADETQMRCIGNVSDKSKDGQF